MNATLEPPVEQTPARIRDKYDEAIEYLTKHPEEIREAWNRSFEHHCGCLFGYATLKPLKGWSAQTRPDGKNCGCLTMIRAGEVNSFDHINAWTDELTTEIKADLSIPSRIEDVTVHHLPIFARWQRIIDQRLNRT